MKITWNVKDSLSVSGSVMLQVTVRVGIFFDGTANNRVNSQVGTDCRAMSELNGGRHILECRGRHDDPGSSYSNDFSNIARLADLYRLQPVAANTGNGLYVYAPAYISGVGTLSGGRDSLWPGQTFGRGATGVIAKVAKAIKKLQGRLEMFQQANPGCAISRLELDVFGFSRGAAAARHFVNEVIKQDKGALGPILASRKLTLSREFSWANRSVAVKVIGLFDTVAAVASLRDMGNVRDTSNHRVNLYLPPGCADQVLHLVARDELRRNFSLSSIKPHWSREIILPGAHSDLGGGYHPQMQEQVLLTRPRWSVVDGNTPATQTPAWQDTLKELLAMDAGMWIDPADRSASLYIATDQQDTVSGSRRMNDRTVMAAVRMERQVFGHLSRVHLRVMHTLACDEGVPFEPIPDRPDLRLLPELHGITKKLIAYARGDVYSLDSQEEQLLMRRYVHRSAHWQAAIGSRGSLGDALFVHAPQSGGRVHHPNVVLPGYPQ